MRQQKIARSITSRLGAASLALFISTAGYGSAQSPAFAGNEGSARVPIVVFQGGWGTCSLIRKFTPFSPVGRKTDLELKKFREKLEALYGTESEYYTGCYTRLKTRARGKARYVTSTEPFIKRRASPADLPGIITELANGRAADIYLIGHSYGGWAAMKAAQQMPANIHVALLATLDPISQIACSAWTFVAYGSTEKESEGCRLAPPDITASEAKLVQQKTGYWINFYQNDYGRLQSGAMPAADENVRREYGINTHRAHLEMPLDSVIWQRLGKEATRIYTEGGTGHEP